MIKKVSLLGPEFTYTDFAADAFLRGKKAKVNSLTKGIEAKVYRDTIEEVMLDVEKGRAAVGVVPIENRLHGTVRCTLDGLFIHRVQIIAELTLPIKHCISVLPGAKPADIKIIMSHDQALHQCHECLKKNFPKCDRVAVSSSAKAFETVKIKDFRHIAVIGPEEAAKKHGFKIIKKDIADEIDNSTKFIVIAKRCMRKRVPDSPLTKKPNTTSIAFYFSRDKSGSLFTVFKAFADNSVNMTKIESRPYKADYGNYLFFIDFEGHPAQKNVETTLKEVDSLVAGLKILGIY